LARRIEVVHLAPVIAAHSECVAAPLPVQSLAKDKAPVPIAAEGAGAELDHPDAARNVDDRETVERYAFQPELRHGSQLVAGYRVIDLLDESHAKIVEDLRAEYMSLADGNLCVAKSAGGVVVRFVRDPVLCVAVRIVAAHPDESFIVWSEIVIDAPEPLPG